MVSLTAPVCGVGALAAPFSLPATDGKILTLKDCRGERGLVVMFICNHCPYVKAIFDRLVRDVKEMKLFGVNAVAIMPNDPELYPEDSFENMKQVAKELPFPYLFDETQDTARAYGAVCTPDFFGYNKDLQLQYRGRLDSSLKQPSPSNAPRDLFEAMKKIAKTGRGPQKQISSIGCSIKWRAA